jgi:four helix bundle protein
MQDFHNLKAWQKAHALTLAVYQATLGLPSDERFGLTFLLRRSAMAIPMNAAEGCGRATDAEFHKSVSAAMGAASQLEYHLLLAHDLSYLPGAEYARLTADVIEVKKMLAGLLHSLNG